jgi:hypothetical protein
MSTRDKLAAEVLAATWRDLRPHHERGGLVLVRQDLDLLDAAVALADDRTDRLQVWLAVGRVVRCDEAAAADLAARSPRFQFVIVQPWVVAQELPDQSSTTKPSRT